LTYRIVYYESIKREPKIRGIKKCRCDERLIDIRSLELSVRRLEMSFFSALAESMIKFTMPPGRVRGIVFFLLLLVVPYIFIIAYFAISGSRSRSGGQSQREREKLSTSEDYAQFEYPVAKADECGPVASRGNAVLKWIQLLGAQVILF
jgi:hypothetical protein